MTRRLVITSSSNDRLKALRRLQRPRHARTNGLVVVEGHRQLRCVLDARLPVRDVYAAPELFLGRDDDALVTLAERQGARVFELTSRAFASIATNVRPDGVAALVERPRHTLDELRVRRRHLLLVCEAIERPGNLGTLVRTACAAGASAVVVCDAATDPFHPETVRGSVGAIFRIPVVDTSTPAAIAALQRMAIPILVATPDGPLDHWDAPYGGSLAVVVGSERHGVSDAWRAAADHTVRIPMSGAADSLNVGVAAGIVLFEAARQRARSEANFAVHV